MLMFWVITIKIIIGNPMVGVQIREFEVTSGEILNPQECHEDMVESAQLLTEMARSKHWPAKVTGECIEKETSKA